MPEPCLRQQREIHLDQRLVSYALTRGRRRSIGFVVGADGLRVNAPQGLGLVDIEAALRARGGWIVRKLAEQQQHAARLREARVDWRDGASIPFLGQDVTIVLDPRAAGAVLCGEATGLPALPLTLRLGLPHDSGKAQIRDAVQRWLKRQARRVFEERCQLFGERLGVACRRLSLSSARTRWGSASANGSIRLNWRLIHFALAAIDYVVAHELAHLREMNHGPRFWELVRSVLPDFETTRGLLKHQVPPEFE